MGKKITFYVLSNTGSPMRQTTVSKLTLSLITIFIVSCVFSLGILGFDYYQLKNISLNNQNLEKKIYNQLDEIANQREQIQKFAAEINALKLKIVDLNSFEKKIRIIANIEKTADQDSLFGIGGTMPEDLDTNVLLSEKHNSLLREMHDQVQNLDHATQTQEESFDDLLKYLEEQRNLLASTPAIRPTRGWVSSRFGYRESPFTGRRVFHKGLDIANRKGTPIIATADGVVTHAGPKGLLGNVLIIDHGHGIVTRYGHMNSFAIKRGEVVKRGDLIGQMGNTGRSTGPHLHYEVRLNGLPVNPVKYILN